MRKDKPIEREDVEALFRCIIQHGYDAPRSIRDWERSDFIVQIGDRTIGLETTSAVYQEYVRAGKLKRGTFPDGCSNETRLKDGNRRRSNKEILNDMRTRGGWRCEPAEEYLLEWRDKIARSLQAKREKLNQETYQRFDENWLLIQDKPGLHNDFFTRKQAGDHLYGVCSEPPAASSDFDTVFISSGRHLFIWTESRLTWHYQG